MVDLGPSVSPSYTSIPKYAIVEDSYLRIVVLNLQKSGNKFVTVQLEYQNKTDNEITIEYSSFGGAAILVDNLGNESWIQSYKLATHVIPPKGKKSLGLGFSFEGKKELGNDFSLTINHFHSPPGSVCFTNLKTK